MQNRLIKLDVREVRSYNDVTNNDYTIRNTDIYITTAETPSVRLALFGEHKLFTAQRFIKTTCLHTLPPVLGGVWFQTNIVDPKQSKRTLLMVVDENSLANFKNVDEAILEFVKHLVHCAKFTNETFVNDLIDYIVSSYQTFKLTDGLLNLSSDNIDDQLAPILDDERYLFDRLDSEERGKLYSTMINGLFTKYCEMSNETTELFKNSAGYEVTDVTVHQINQIIEAAKQNSVGGTAKQPDQAITDKLFFKNFGVN